MCPFRLLVVKLHTGKGFFEALQYRFKHAAEGSTDIRDIYDGEQYNKLFTQGILANPNNISFRHNTDGVVVFNSSMKDVWPIYLQINELPPTMRSICQAL